jgi:hypothetical protein
VAVPRGFTTRDPALSISTTPDLPCVLVNCKR